MSIRILSKDEMQTLNALLGKAMVVDVVTREAMQEAEVSEDDLEKYGPEASEDGAADPDVSLSISDTGSAYFLLRVKELAQQDERHDD